MKFSKNVNNKKFAPKLIFFNEKKIVKDSDSFWYRKLTLKVKRLGDFALFDTFPLSQFSKFKNFLWVCCFLGKNLSNFVTSIWKLHNPYWHNIALWTILIWSKQHYFQKLKCARPQNLRQMSTRNFRRQCQKLKHGQPFLHPHQEIAKKMKKCNSRIRNCTWKFRLVSLIHINT